jgi:hypothetical protein
MNAIIKTSTHQEEESRIQNPESQMHPSSSRKQGIQLSSDQQFSAICTLTLGLLDPASGPDRSSRITTSMIPFAVGQMAFSQI